MKQSKRNPFRLLLMACTFLCLAFQSKAQTLTVSGKIIDAVSSKAIEGATIDNGSQKVLSAANGSYTIKAEKGAKITVTYVGYQTYTVAVNGATLDIKLAASTDNLEDVVVTALGVKKEKRKLGYSTQDIKGADLVKAREVNPINGLIGKVAGLTVGINQELLRAPNLVLRGGSVNLIVVDGVPINSDTWNISPDDIESYNVLKGPVASALYGYRGQMVLLSSILKKELKIKEDSL